MPGLMNKENRSALPLSVSDITSCVRGYTLAMTASLTYENIEDHAIEGEDRRERSRRPACLFAPTSDL